MIYRLIPYLFKTKKKDDSKKGGHGVESILNMDPELLDA